MILSTPNFYTANHDISKYKRVFSSDGGNNVAMFIFMLWSRDFKMQTFLHKMGGPFYIYHPAISGVE